MPNQKLTIVSVDNFEQQIGNSVFAVFTAETETKEFLPVAITHNKLKAQGIHTELLDNLVGSTVICTKDTNVKNGVVLEADFRIRGILDGTLINDDLDSKNYGKPITILLLNRTNCQIIKSNVYLAEVKDMASTTQAKVQIEEKKERALQSSRRIADRMRALAGSTPETAPKKEETPVLETNEDTPF